MAAAFNPSTRLVTPLPRVGQLLASRSPTRPTPNQCASSASKIAAFARSSRIETLDLMTRRVRAITSGLDDLPAWSPDGKKLAFVRGQSGVYVIRGDGSG